MTTLEKNPSFRTERDFGLVVGGIFAALGAWWMFRSRFGLVAPGVCTLGTALLILGLTAPRLLVVPYRSWMALAEKLSVIMTHAILAVVFFAVMMPIGVWKRFRGWDPLQRRGRSAPSYWKPYPERQRNARHYERMF